MDFVSDALFDRRRLRALTVVDALTREALAIDVTRGIKGEQVVEAMKRISTLREVPRVIRVDNGPEFISKALDRRAYENSVKLDFSRPGKPTDNAFVEPKASEANRSTGGSRTNASIPMGSCHWTMPGARLRRDDGTIMSAVFTHRLAG